MRIGHGDDAANGFLVLAEGESVDRIDDQLARVQLTQIADAHSLDALEEKYH
jgi:hypothetical protein